MRNTLVKMSASATLLATVMVANAGVVLQDSFDTLDTAKWTVTNKTGTSATVTNGQLNLNYNAGGVWGPGSSLTSGTLAFDGTAPVEFTIEKISLAYDQSETNTTLYHNYKLGFSSKAFISYQHSKANEVVQLYIDGTKVYDSSVWPAEGIIGNNTYIGFRLTTTGWELIQSTDGVTYTTRKSGSLAINLNFSDQAVIANTNAHGSGNDLILDNVTVSTVPEVASLSLLGLGALALLSRRR